MSVMIRRYESADAAVVRAVQEAAFGSSAEADLSEALMAASDAEPFVALVAEEAGQVIGFVLFTCAFVDGASLQCLAPLAVTPARQGTGVGEALVEAGLQAVAETGAAGVVVLGHPSYYPRFGFTPASALGIQAPYPVDPDEAWMAIELAPGTLDGVSGIATFAAPLMDPAMWVE